MTTPIERSNISALAQASGEPPEGRAEASDEPRSPAEKFDAPGVPTLNSLTDGRELGHYNTEYPASAWVQIFGELIYLLLVLTSSVAVLAMLARYVIIQDQHTLAFWLLGPYPQSKPLVSWMTAGLAGACGGCTSSLKWLYHTIAKRRWHRDRVVWRLVVPILSSSLALFSALIVHSHMVPFLSDAPVMSPVGAAAFGYFVGLFSDNVLGGLQKAALNVFGTLNK